MKDQNLRGVGGWLAWAIFCLMFLSPVGGTGALSQEFEKAETQYPSLQNIHAWTQYKTDAWIVWAACAAMSVYAGFLLLKRHNQHSVRFVIWTMWITGPLRGIFDAFVIVPLVLKVHVNASYPVSTLGSVIESSLICIIWTLYFIRSVRVGNTYGFVTRLSPPWQSRMPHAD